jgi:hypothetical protein
LLKYGTLTTLFQAKEVTFPDAVRAACEIITGISKNMFHLPESRKHFRNDIVMMNATKGYVKNSISVSIDPDCKLNTTQNKSLELDFIGKLKTRYEKMGIHVLYCISPMPVSDVGSEFFKNHYTQADNAVITMPNYFFTDSRHMTESGAVYNSKIFANYLQTRLRNGDGTRLITRN